MIEKNDPKRKELCDKVIETVKEQDIKFIYLQFTDIHGIIKSFEINAKRIEDFLQDGENFDGSSITGYGAIEESDKVAIPDPSTFCIIPWRKEKNVARFLSDIYNPDGSRYNGDPRYILQKAVKKAKEHGYEYFCAPELEFFILEKDTKEKAFSPSDMRGYFDYDPYDINERMRFTFAEYCDAMGIEIEVLHHEVALGQHEIDFKYGPAVETADNTNTIKMIVKTVAAQNNMTATFMPKPFAGINGSGMHVHQSLWKDGKNIFYDPNDKNQLSKVAKYFIAGLLKYVKEICVILNPTVNSYKRLVPGYEAPTYISWANRNRSALIRIPSKRGKSTRCELRNPDLSGNPYLQFAVMLAAGWRGVEEKIEPPEPVEKNIYALTKEERMQHGIDELPDSLGHALLLTSKSEFVKEILGDHIYDNFLHVKHKEWEEYRMQVTKWEIDRYLPLV